MRNPARRGLYALAACALAACALSAGSTAEAQTIPATPQQQPPTPHAAEAGPAQFRASIAEGLGFRTADGVFGLDVGMVTRSRYGFDVNDAGLARHGFDVVMARPQVRFHALDDTLRLFMQPEFAAATPRLLDLEVTWQPARSIAIRAGQFVTPFSRAFITPVPLLQFPEFSAVNVRFRSDRQVGAMAFGAAAGGRFEYYLGAFNGNGINAANDDTSLMGVARVAVNPLRAMPYDEVPGLRGGAAPGLALGLNVIADRAHPARAAAAAAPGGPTAVPPSPESRVTLGADVAFAAGPLSLLAEGFLREVYADDGHQTTSFGAYLQAGCFVVPRHFELGARGGWVDPDNGRERVAQVYADALATYYAYGQHLKLQAMYALVDDAAQSGTANGRATHRALLQLQLWI